MKYFKTIFIVAIVLGVYFAGPVSAEETDNNNDGEYGEYFEGDMLLTEEQRLAIKQAVLTRNGLRDPRTRWPGRTVVYHIHEEDFDGKQIKMIRDAMADIASKSCIRFRQRTTNKEHALDIRGNKPGCFSTVGYNGGGDQRMNLAKGCFVHGIIIHEMLHSLGFYHMQSTFDRNKFVKIVWENIKDAAKHNFEQYTSITVTDFGVPYDYGSVMHYHATAFSKNGGKTIIPLQEGAEIGQRRGMSEKDILKLNKMYCQKSDADSKLEL